MRKFQFKEWLKLKEALLTLKTNKAERRKLAKSAKSGYAPGRVAPPSNGLDEV